LSELVDTMNLRSVADWSMGELMSAREVDDERLLRFAIWGELQASPGPDAVRPSTLQQLELYRGQRGIWVNKARTQNIADDGIGVTVALAHTGTVYDDDMSDEGIIYRYPRTNMPGRDRNEIDATKNARRLGIPVFVIASSPESSSVRRVRLGWVAEWDDATGQFLVMFGEEPKAVDVDPADDEPFSALEPHSQRLRLTTQRSGQAQFHFGVFMRYGPACSLCRFDVREALDAPHIVPVKNRGTNDARNGLVMCATHHRAFDAHLFGIEPGSLRIRFATDGPDARRLGVSVADLAGLRKRPHPAALEWRWEYWKEHAHAS
jgi:putative restriction endonuclease